MKKSLFLIVSFIMVFFVCAHAKANKKYLALGDSITYGYTLENREEECFASLFAKKYNLDVTNEAYPGDQTSDLIEKMNDYNLNDYDVITLCIGANDVFKEFLDDVREMDDVVDILNYIVSIEENEDFNNRVDEKLKQFDINLGIIMERLRNTKAQIYMMNVYNPFNRFSVEKLDIITDKYVRRINEIIEKHNKGTYFINLYNKFEKSKKELINSQTNRKGYTTDPHPNTTGHKFICDLLSNEYELHNYELKNLILAISIGIVVIILEISEIIFTNKKFNAICIKNVDIAPKNEEEDSGGNNKSRFIRS